MKNFLSKNNTGLVLMVICVSLAAISMSFQTMQFGPLQQFDSLTDIPQDTIPSKLKDDNLNMQEFSELMQNLDVEMKKAVKEFNKVDMAKMSDEIQSSLKKIDADKIKKQISKALKEIDLVSIQNEMKKAFKEVEWSKVNEDIKSALDDASKEIEGINMKEINEQLAKAKVEIEKAKSALKKINLDKTLKEATVNLNKAEKYFKLQKEMFAEMEKDGLIKPKEGFSIQYKNKQLIINGKIQPDSVADKYRHYIPDDHYEIIIDKE